MHSQGNDFSTSELITGESYLQYSIFWTYNLLAMIQLLLQFDDVVHFKNVGQRNTT